MSDQLTASLRAFEAGLSDREQAELSAMERSAMVAETSDLLNKAQANKGGAMGIGNRQAQLTPPPQGAPTGPAKAGQAPAAPAPMPGEMPVQAQGAPPPAQAPAAPVVAQADGIDSYIDEKEVQAADPLSNGEMGIQEPNGKVAAYVGTYGHLRIRPTVKNALEVYDPQKNATLMLVRPNSGTRKDAQKLRRCAVDVLASIGHHGLVRTAQLWKAQLKRGGASGGIVDYGDTSMQTKNDFSDDSINDRGETNMQQDITLGVESTTGEGDNLTTKDKPDTRQPAGLSGKAAGAVPAKGGILPGHETNMADPPANVKDGNSLSSLDNAEDNLAEKRPTKNTGSDSTLSDAINTFANESITAGRRRSQAITQEPPIMGAQPAINPTEKGAQAGAPPMPPPAMPQTAQGEPAAPGMGADGLPPQTAQGDPSMVDPAMDPSMDPAMDPNMDPSQMSTEEKIAHLYRRRFAKQMAAEKRTFVARMVRCMRVAARRQALNLEPNQLKIAVADALMTECPISRHEVYVPMDGRTATFVIERGLDQANAIAYVDSLIKRSASFMKMSDEALTQVEEDLENIQPVAPTEKGAQAENGMPSMPQMAQDEGMDPNMDPNMDPSMDPMGGDPGMDPNMDPNMPIESQQNDPSAMDPGMDPSMQFNADDQQGVGGMPDDMQLVDPMTQAQEQRAATIRRRASNGNLPINTGAAGDPMARTASGTKREKIRFAVSATKSAGLHNYFGSKQ